MSNPMARVVERQMRNWELARSQRLEVSEPKQDEVEDFIELHRKSAEEKDAFMERLRMFGLCSPALLLVTIIMVHRSCGCFTCHS